MSDAYSFVKESNAIEGIYGEPTDGEMEEYHRFTDLKIITLEDMKRFVSVYQANARLRDKAGLNVQVGTHIPPAGGAAIKKELIALLEQAKRTQKSAYETHQQYETLHPFTDGNGRSGRMLWMWQMQENGLSFLHRWYYQTLEFGGQRKQRNE